MFLLPFFFSLTLQFFSVRETDGEKMLRNSNIIVYMEDESNSSSFSVCLSQTLTCVCGLHLGNFTYLHISYLQCFLMDFMFLAVADKTQNGDLLMVQCNIGKTKHPQTTHDIIYIQAQHQNLRACFFWLQKYFSIVPVRT